jgi:uncharacterized membrane protein YphA (DoxX/SURF4 family)
VLIERRADEGGIASVVEVGANRVMVGTGRQLVGDRGGPGVERELVGRREHGHRFDTEGGGRPGDPDGDLAPVGNQYSLPSTAAAWPIGWWRSRSTTSSMTAPSGLIVGIGTRIAAAVGIVILAGALAFVKLPDILGSSELDLAYVAGLSAVLLLGPGRLSIGEALRTDHTHIDIRDRTDVRDHPDHKVGAGV